MIAPVDNTVPDIRLKKNAGFEDTLILEPNPNVVKQRKPLIGRIWDNLNEPVIEIGGDKMKKKDNE